MSEPLALILIAACSVLNRLRGIDAIPLSRFGFALLIGAAAQVYYLLEHPACLPASWKVFGIVSVGIYLWSLPGWGRGFTCFHGRKEPLFEPEIRWIDRLTDLVFSVMHGTKYDASVRNQLYASMTPNEVRVYGTIWMTIRGLYLYPMFGVLALTVQPMAAAIGFAALLQGFAYAIMRYVPERQAVMGAELTFGAVIGTMLVMVLR